jgi:hypothetical protein
MASGCRLGMSTPPAQRVQTSALPPNAEESQWRQVLQFSSISRLEHRKKKQHRLFEADRIGKNLRRAMVPFPVVRQVSTATGFIRLHLKARTYSN